MAVQKLEITNEYNQRISTTVEVDSAMIDIEIFLEYNKMAGYWVASLKDVAKDQLVISSMPLLASQNLLGQYGYLELGSSAVVNIAGDSDDDLDDSNFGTDFIWCWGNNV